MNKNTSLNDYIDYNKRYIIIIITLSVLLVIIFSIYITREFILKKDNNNTNSSINYEQTPPQEELPKEEVIEKDILWTSKELEEGFKYEVYIKGNELYINEDIIEKDIKKYLNVKIGGDACEGNAYIISLKEDNTISSLSIDSLSCDNIIEYNKIADLENVEDIYYEPSLAEENTSINNIYATVEDSPIIINDYLSLK